MVLNSTSTLLAQAAEIQRAYWTHNVEEQSQLEAIGLEQLSWRELLRLHHLFCLQRIDQGPENLTAAEKCLQTARFLLAANSPYRPRSAEIWQEQATQLETNRESDLQGMFLNPSLTHIGCLEVFRIDAMDQLVAIDFVSFDELSGILFAQPSLIRAAKLLYEDGRDEIVFIPLLYGLTWAIGNEYEQTGQITRFIAHLDNQEISDLGVSGIGVGQQDLFIRGQDNKWCALGLGSIVELYFPLNMRDPRFEEKARARGIDPYEAYKLISGDDATATNSSKKVYCDQEHGFSFSYPASWSAENSEKMGGLLIISPEQEANWWANAFFQVRTNPEGTKLEKFTQDHLPNLKIYKTEFELSEIKFIALKNGAMAGIIDYTHVLHGVKLREREILVPMNEDKILFIVVSTAESTQSKYLPIFEAMIDSIELES